MSVEVSLLFGAIGTLLGIVSAIVVLKKESKSQGTAEANIASQVNYIATGVDNIRLDLKEQGRKVDAQNDRLIRVEESAKIAHKRIDKLEGDE